MSDRIDTIVSYLIGDDVSKLRNGTEKKRQKLHENEMEEKLLRSIAEIFVSMGVDNYDPLVLCQLSLFVRNHVRSVMLRAVKLQRHRSQPSASASSTSSSSSSSTYSGNDTETKITLADVQAAVRSWGQNRALMQEDSSVARKQARKLNSKPLPKIKAVFGMQVPEPAKCFLNEEYTVAVVEEPGSGAIELNSSSSSSPQQNVKNSQQRRYGRKRRRGRKNSDTSSSGGNKEDIDFSQIPSKRAKKSSTGSSGSGSSSSSSSSSSGVIRIKIG